MADLLRDSLAGRRLPLGVVAAMVLGIALPGRAAGSEIAAPTFAVGDWWLVRTGADVRGRGFRAKVVRIEDDRMAIVEGAAQGESSYDLQLNKLEADEPPAGRRTIYRPHSRSLEFPLFPGKRWGGEVEWSAGPYSGKFEVKATAGDLEKVTLRYAAGARRGETEQIETIRIDYEHADRGHVTRSTCWYAPQLRIPVRCESTDPLRAYEVLDYGLAGGRTSPREALAHSGPALAAPTKPPYSRAFSRHLADGLEMTDRARRAGDHRAGGTREASGDVASGDGSLPDSVLR